MSSFLLIFTGGHQVNEMGMLDNPIFFLSKALDQACVSGRFTHKYRPVWMEGMRKSQ